LFINFTNCLSNCLSTFQLVYDDPDKENVLTFLCAQSDENSPIVCDDPDKENVVKMRYVLNETLKWMDAVNGENE
jgi:hypothetical protein